MPLPPSSPPVACLLLPKKPECVDDLTKTKCSLKGLGKKMQITDTSFFLVLSYSKVGRESSVKSSSHFCWNLLLDFPVSPVCIITQLISFLLGFELGFSVVVVVLVLFFFVISHLVLSTCYSVQLFFSQAIIIWSLLCNVVLHFCNCCCLLNPLVGG